MKLSTRAKKNLRGHIPLSSKLFVKRLFVGTVGATVRLAARAVNFTRRVLDLAAVHGLDINRAWNVKATPKPFAVESWGARDFLFLLDAMNGAQSPDESVRPVAPRTSVIIPVFNKVEYTFQCLRSLLREIDFNETEIIVVNNASRDETREVLARFGNLVRVIDNEENRGFVDACNQGAAAARGEFLVFLNNDTSVMHGWLRHLLETAESSERVGAVGSMFLYPDGLIQEAGAIVWKTGEAFHYGWGASPDDQRYNFAREVDYCSGASLLIRKEIFERLGGFDRRFAPAYYEDTDLCFGVRSLGYKVIYQPMSRLIHYEGATAGTDVQSGFKRFQILNREKFYEKWREVLERDHFDDDPSLVEIAANRKRAPHVIVFDDRIPAPDRDAGGARMSFILKALAEWSRPVFVSVGKRARPEYEKLLWKEGIETASAADYLRLLKERNFCAAILSRPSVAEAVLPSIRRADRRLKVVFDTVDVHFIRLEREFAVSADASIAEEASHYRKLEIDLARRSDLVWCTSDEDKKAIEREARAVKIELIPTIHRLHGRGKSFDERRDILFIGNFHHSPNADAVHHFIKEIFPLIRQAIPETNFLVVGDNAPPEIRAYASEAVQVLGYVPDIDPLFERARVFVAPLRFGAGMKGKIGEALAYGLPVVTTSIGAEGIGLRHGEEALIADEPQAFADTVIQLYRDENLWERLADGGYRHVERHFTPQVVGEIINRSVKELGCQQEQIKD